MKTNHILLFITFILCISCANPGKQQNSINNLESEKDSIIIVTKPYKNTDNVTEYEIPVIRGTGIKHGIQKRYYLYGSLYSEIPYVRGKREGMAKTYYPAAKSESPAIWKEQPYKNNALNGICRRYHRNGKLQAEYEYKDGLPAIGLKEYTTSGKPVKLPVLTLSKSNTGVYHYVTARLSDNEKDVDYFVGDLVEGKYFPKRLKGLQVKNGIGEIVLPLDTKKVTITAVMYTEYQNCYITSRTISF